MDNKRNQLAVDKTDSKVLKILMHGGRATWAELADAVGLSAPAAADRVRRMERRGLIRGYAALVDPDKAGCPMAAFVAVSLERPAHRAAFLALVLGMPEVQECHHVAGEDDFVLKVRCGGTRHLEEIVSVRIKSLAGVARTRTSIVLSTAKETTVLPLPDLSPAPSRPASPPRRRR